MPHTSVGIHVQDEDLMEVRRNNHGNNVIDIAGNSIFLNGRQYRDPREKMLQYEREAAETREAA
jgi:hypothetical protein